MRSESAGCDRFNSSAALLKLAWSNTARKARRSSQLEIDAHPTSIETIFALVDRQVAVDNERGRALAARRLRRAGTESA
jgi:hypothetical protein